MQQWGKSARLHVFAKVHAAQIEPARVRFVGFFSAGEGRVVAAARRRNLPGQQARRDGHDGVQMARLELLGKAGEREHAGVLCADVVGERETRHHGGLSRLQRPTATASALRFRKPLRIASGDVARARDVPHDEHVLRLGDHGLEVAGVVTLNRFDLRVGRQLHVCQRQGRKRDDR